ncbi:MAG: RNA polymerase sigma factor [Bacteroidales bacterium]|nr:RNA polymerase sigma factor [Bacteroidales bacterium]MCF8334533.1 RNA polymerase sigma factor [Bacteroidales bacterium]
MLPIDTLITHCLQNDEKAQKRLYSRFAPKLFGICKKFATNKQEAEDLLQEGFIKIFKNLQTFRNEGVFEAWMRRIVINTSINYRSKKLPAFQDIDSDRWKSQRIQSTIIAKLSYRELLEYVRQLPTGYQEVFNLNAIEGYTHKEISQKLNISVNTSKSQLSRARKCLQSKIGKNHKPPENSDNFLPKIIVL